MAVIATAEVLGENETLYIRLNNFEQLTNHGVPAVARFRGYASREAHEAGKPYRFEREVAFTADIDQALWPQAYEALKAELTDATDA